MYQMLCHFSWEEGYRRLSRVTSFLTPMIFSFEKGLDGRWTLTQHQNKLVNAVAMYLICRHFLFLLQLPSVPGVPTVPRVCTPMASQLGWDLPLIPLLPLVCSWPQVLLVLWALLPLLLDAPFLWRTSPLLCPLATNVALTVASWGANATLRTAVEEPKKVVCNT